MSDPGKEEAAVQSDSLDSSSHEAIEEKAAPLIAEHPPPLPPHHEGHRQSYGFPVNYKRVKDAVYFLRGTPEDIDLPYLSDYEALFWFLDFIQQETGCTLGFAAVFADEETPSDVPRFEFPVPPGAKAVSTIHILTLASWEGTDWASERRSRPTVDQVNIVTKIMGTQPRWFTNVLHSRFMAPLE